MATKKPVKQRSVAKANKPAKKRPPKKQEKAGRPSTYTRAKADAILEKIAEGQSLASICKEPGMPTASAFRRWVIDDTDGISTRSARAYSIGHDAIADDCVRIADDGTNDYMENNMTEAWILNGESIQRSRLRVDTRLRLLGKWAPKKYGDKIDVAVSGKIDIAESVRSARERAAKGTA
jgi:hypothetical protein